MDNKCIVAVPVYKNDMTEFEEVSLKQCFKILSSHDICFFGPENCRDYYITRFPIALYEVFEDHFFLSTESYSDLLLDKDFYNRFIDYEYILIYQLDAFVFSDRIMNFCSKGFDFIGAPIRGKGWGKFHVGNGGLSLRKVESAIRMIEIKQDILNNADDESILLEYEDTFFGYCGYNPELEFVVPDIYTAGEFAAALDVGHAIRNIKNRKIPFGCHEWNRLNYQVWKPLIEAEGYSLPEVSNVNNRDVMENERQKRLNLFIFHVLKHSSDAELKRYKDALGLNNKNNIYIRGTGGFAQDALRILRLLQVEVDGFVDKKAAFESFGEKKVFDLQHVSNLKESFIVIGTIKYEKEIEYELITDGKIKHKDFCLYSEMFSILRSVICSDYPDVCGITTSIIKADAIDF